jgi:hypothetical protein
MPIKSIPFSILTAFSAVALSTTDRNLVYVGNSPRENGAKGNFAFAVG